MARDLISLDGFLVKLFLRFAPTLLTLCKTTVVVDISRNTSLDDVFVVFFRGAATRGAPHLSHDTLRSSGLLRWLFEVSSTAVVSSCTTRFSSWSAHSSAHKYIGFMHVLWPQSRQKKPFDVMTNKDSWSHAACK